MDNTWKVKILVTGIKLLKQEIFMHAICIYYVGAMATLVLRHLTCEAVHPPCNVIVYVRKYLQVAGLGLIARVRIFDTKLYMSKPNAL